MKNIDIKLKYSYLFILTILFTVGGGFSMALAQSSSIDTTLLQKTWHLSSDKVIENMTGIQKTHYESLKVSEQNALKSKIYDCAYTFQTGGDLEMQKPISSGTSQETQSWRVDTSTNLLYIDDGTSEKAYEVITLTTTELTLKGTTNNKLMYFIL